MKNKPKRQQVIYEVAIGGISAAMALLLVYLSVVVRYGSVGFYVAASLALVVPLSQRYYFAAVSAYAVSVALAFAIVGDITAICGYAVYFAPMALISGFMHEKKVKLYISLPIKTAYIVGALALMYYVFGTIMISADLPKVKFWLVAVVGTVALIAIDFLMTVVYDIIKRRMQKILRRKDTPDRNPDVDEQIEKENPFDDFEQKSDVENNVVLNRDDGDCDCSEDCRDDGREYNDEDSENEL